MAELDLTISIDSLVLNRGIQQNDAPIIVAKVRGVTKLLGVAQKMRVGIVHRSDFFPISHFYSKADGSFEYQVSRDFVGRNDISVVVFDDSNTANASVIDNIEPEVIV